MGTNFELFILSSAWKDLVIALIFLASPWTTKTSMHMDVFVLLWTWVVMMSSYWCFSFVTGASSSSSCVTISNPFMSPAAVAFSRESSSSIRIAARTSSDLPVKPEFFWTSSISLSMLSGNDRLTTVKKIQIFLIMSRYLTYVFVNNPLAQLSWPLVRAF